MAATAPIAAPIQKLPLMTRSVQPLDGGVDRGVFSADAGPGEEAEQRVGLNVPGQCGRGGGEQIKCERDEEQLAASDTVGEPAEAERADHGAGEIGAVGEANVEIGELQRRAFLQRSRECAGQCYFEPVEDPGDAEREHDAGVKAAPSQMIEPRRDAGLDEAGIVLHHRRGGAFLLRGAALDPLRIHCDQ
jgi:hypothetical protein